jgi:ribosomal-protein-serine acetyltransferase
MEPSTAGDRKVIPVGLSTDSSGIELRLVTPADAAELYRMIDRNRAYLAEWLPWVTPEYVETDLSGFLEARELENRNREALTTAIVADGRICGSIALHRIDQFHRSTSIGYWLDEAHNGRGIMTRSCRALVSEAFEGYGLHRVEIRCAVGNNRSAAIPERLGFREEGILRGAELVHGRFLDLRVFSMLSHEWRRV